MTGRFPVEEGVLAQPVFAWLLPRHPVLLTLGQIVEVPCHEAYSTECRTDQHENSRD
jgi:hypothetical protein